MKPHIRKLALIMVLVAIIPLYLAITGIALPTCYGETYYAQLAPMYQRLQNTDGKKLIVLGGSNVAFGLDGTYLQQLLSQQGYQYTVCPFGLYAAVGTSAMLDLSLNTLSAGDVVVLAMEPTSETLSSYFGATAFWKCAEEAPELLLPLNSDRKAAMIGSYLQYLQDRLVLVQTDSIPHPTDVYGKASFDVDCNMTYPRPGNILSLGYDTGTPVDFSAIEISEDFADQVNRYCQEATRKGAHVYLSFSPVNRTAVVDESAAVDFFNQCLDAFSCPIISDPSRYILDSGWFYDSNFHLNTAGAKLRTFRLAEDLLAQLGCYTPLDSAQLPDMPAAAVSVDTTDSTADTGDFLYELHDSSGTYLISGISESGKEKKSLAIPASVDGVAVAGFSGSPLESSVLEELTLPASIETLPDGLFSHCPRLTRLVLTSLERPCGISENTFSGAPDSLRIFVPQEAYPMYRDGYGCTVNLWSHWLDRVYSY